MAPLGPSDQVASHVLDVALEAAEVELGRRHQDQPMHAERRIRAAGGGIQAHPAARRDADLQRTELRRPRMALRGGAQPVERALRCVGIEGKAVPAVARLYGATE